jgi:tetratricopeptide (TPR) repeat protein
MEDLFKDYASSHEQVQNGLREYIAEARSYRGKALYLLGKKEEAIADLTKGTQEAYDYYQIGLIYFKKEKYTEVVECMNKAIKKSVYEQINDAYTIRGKAKFYLGEKEGATIDLVEAGSRGMSDAVEFLKQNGLEWGGEAKEKYDRMVSDFSRISSQQNTRTGKYYPGRDEVFTKLRDNIENSDMPYKEKVKAELKLHDDMYKE